MSTDFSKYKNAKLPKRELAKLFRRGANLLEQYGWVEGEMGSKSEGFCAMGALDNLIYGDTSAENITKHVTFSRPAKGKTALTGLGLHLKGNNVSQAIIGYNDNYFAPKGTEYYSDEYYALGKKRIQKLFRTIAARLEHGYSL